MAKARIATTMAAGMLFGALVLIQGACVEDEGMFYATALIQANNEGVFEGARCEGDGVKSSQTLLAYVTDATGTTITHSTAGDFAVCLLNKIKSNRLNGVETSNVVVYEYEISLAGNTATRAVTATVEADTESGSPQLEGGIFPLPITLAGVGQEAELIAAAGGTNAGLMDEVATVIIRGRTTGGLEVDTPEFYIPITVIGFPVVCECGVESIFGCADSDPGCT